MDLFESTLQIEDPMTNILAIGNSFSTDATVYLQKIAASAGEDLFVRNCFIGGCNLKMHAQNLKTDAIVYEEQNDGEFVRMIGLKSALLAIPWDIVTLQQASHDSGIIATYEPFLTQLIRGIKKLVPGAKIVFHQTWAYEIDSQHASFPLYGRNQAQMFQKLQTAIRQAASRHHLEIIPAGEAIQRARSLPAFDYAHGGRSLNRDGFHLTFDYGRYLAALVWFRFLTGKTGQSVEYQPEGADPKLIEQLKSIIE
jgi:hypothetical protein